MQAILWNGFNVAITKCRVGIASGGCIGIVPIAQALMVDDHCGGIGISGIRRYNR